MAPWYLQMIFTETFNLKFMICTDYGDYEYQCEQTNELPKILCSLLLFQQCGKNVIWHAYILCTDVILCRILKPCRAVTCKSKVSQLKQWVTSFSPQRPGFIPRDIGYLANKVVLGDSSPSKQFFSCQFSCHYCCTPIHVASREWTMGPLKAALPGHTASHHSQSHNGGGQGRWFCKTMYQTLAGRISTGNNKL
jgi:hypothetical protein